MFGLIDGFRRRRAVSSYARRLPRLLLQQYGRAPYYSPAQVSRTIERAGLDSEYLCSALAMFSDRGSFDAFHLARGETCDYAAMRADIAEAQFGGNMSFSFHDLLVLDGSGDGHDAGGSHGDGGHADGGHGDH